MSPSQLASNKWGWQRLLPVLLLLLLFGRSLHSLRTTAPTYDEYEYLSRGYLYLKTADSRLKLRHPILLDNLAAAPLLLRHDIVLPLDEPALAAGDFHRYAAVFMWERNQPIAHILFFLGRLPAQWLMLLLAAAIFRWAQLRFGRWSGLFALSLATFDPNLIAHGRLMTPDLGQTTFMFLALFAWWHYWQRPSWQRLVGSGILLGLAQTAGFPALILYPIFFAVLCAQLCNRLNTIARFRLRQSSETAAVLREGNSKQLLYKQPLAVGIGKLLAVGGISALVIWAVYSFRWGHVAAWNLSLPAPYYWKELIDLFARLGREDIAYLNGEVYRGGRVTFFITALLLKTPLATLLLIGWGLLLLVQRRSLQQDMALWLLPLLYYGNALTTSLNIGYRHILPILPFLIVLASGVIAQKARWHTARVGLALLLLGWLGVATWQIHPYYLAYFNELAGGAENGRFYLTVSDLDWGQDLGGLSDYLHQQNIESVYLSYFGTTPPDAYAISYQQLPAWPQRGNPLRYPFHPTYPLPGTYAISAANLVGARFEDAPNTFAYFQNQTPRAIIGHSIFIYEVGRLLGDTGGSKTAVNLALGNLPLADLPAALFTEQFHTNNLNLRWFNPDRALLIPPDGWLALAPNSLHPLLQEHFADRWATSQPFATSASGNGWLLQATPDWPTGTRPLASSTASPETAVSPPLIWDNSLQLLGYEQLTPETADSLTLLTHWQAHAPAAHPLRIFIHLVAPDGTILAQHDGLDVTRWQSGDQIIQLHQLPLPDPLPNGTHWLRLGLYRPDTLDRLPLTANGTPSGDHIFIPLADVNNQE